MGVLERILEELDETYLVEHVTKKHDEARIQYPLRSITVDNDIEFDNLIADYYNFHFTKCVSNGGALSRAESAGRAKEILDNYCRRNRINRLNVYSNGKTGVDGGMRKILDIIMESMKEDSVEKHYKDVIDRYVTPSSWDEQIDLIKEYFKRIPDTSHFDKDHPEKYARDYEELIRNRVEQLKSVSKIFTIK